MINLVFGPGAELGDAALDEPRARRRPLHGLDRRLPLDLADDRQRHRPVPQLPAHRRRDRRQGLHPRPPLRRPRGGRDGDRPRLVRVPGAEVLGLVAALPPLQPLGGDPREPRARRPVDRDGRRARLHELHGRRDRRVVVQDPGGGDRGGEARPAPRSSPAADVDDSEGWFVEPTVIKTDDPDFRLMRDELFGPVVTAYVYDENDWDDTLGLVDRTGTYALTGRGLRERPRGDRAGARRAPLRGGQLLRQRQADRRGRRPAAVRRRARFGDERQGGLDVEPDPLGQPADGQGDARPGDRLPLPVPAAGP